jgi:hypothetical protein
MPKLLGIGYGELPGFIERAQKVSLMGYGDYQFEGSDERDYTPYDVGAFSGPSVAYDLNEPGRVAEIKRALVALGQKNSGNQYTDFWKYIDLSPQFADAWGGPAADAFVAAIGRYQDASLLPGLMSGVAPNPFSDPLVFTQINEVREKDRDGQDTGNYFWVGGAQPTLPGAELIAQAARQLTPDGPQLDQYWKWRADQGSDLKDCTSTWNPLGLKQRCSPPQVSLGGAYYPVATSHVHGRPWIDDRNGMARSYVLANRKGAHSTPDLLGAVDQAHSDLRYWLGQLELPGVGEQHRLQSMSMIINARSSLRDAAKKLNRGLEPPECPEDQIWVTKKGICEPQCHAHPGTTWDPVRKLCAVVLPEVDICGRVYKDVADCVAYQTGQDGPCRLSKQDALAHCSGLDAEEFGDKKLSSSGAGLWFAAAAIGGALFYLARARNKKTDASRSGL